MHYFNSTLDKCWIKIVHLLEPIKTVSENARWNSEAIKILYYGNSRTADVLLQQVDRKSNSDQLWSKLKMVVVSRMINGQTSF
jgi:hypothetical protein